MFLRRFFLPVSSILVVLLIAACGSSTSTSSTTPASSPSPAPTSSTPAAVIMTANASVKGQSETILTDAQGKTLYYFTPDTADKVACTAACAKAWPPLPFTSSGTPLGDAPLSGTLSVINGANGMQVVYNGHPLYTFSGDTAAGQTQGEGLGGKWFVCTPDLAA